MKWFGHTERMKNEEFVKKVYMSSVEGSSRRGRPLGRWENRVKKYMSGKGVKGNGLEQARRDVWIGRGGGPSNRGHPLGDASGGSEALERLTD